MSPCRFLYPDRRGSVIYMTYEFIFLWGYTKAQVYPNKLQTLEHLKTNIRQAFAGIKQLIFDRVNTDWRNRVPQAAVRIRTIF